MLSTVIVGFGNAGRGLHLRSLLHARRLCKGEPIFATSRIAAVDPRLYVKPRAREDQTVSLARTLDGVADADPGTTVAHVCTPPRARVDTLERLSARGYSRIICEKPVAGSLGDLHQMLRIITDHGMDVAVVSPWLSSTLTLRLRDMIASEELGGLKSVRIVQRKPRFTRTRDKLDHPTAFEVELPHSMGVALHLAGRDATVVDASSSAMQVDGSTYPHMGGAGAVLEHPSGVRTTIECDLTAPVRERSIELKLEHGTVIGSYPVGDDTYAQLRVQREGEPAGGREIICDDQLAKMMIEWYSYFAGLGPRPVSDLRFNVEVMDTIAEAKRAAGIEDVERIIQARTRSEEH